MQIKTYNSTKPVTLSLPKGNSEPAELQFYVLCKGMNSGKPLCTPCPNCFTVSANTQEEKETLYWLTYTMWKGNAFHPYLRGSVIPFITIHDYRQQITAALRRLQPSGAQVQQVVNVLKHLDDKEVQAREQLKIIAQVKQIVVRKFIRL